MRNMDDKEYYSMMNKMPSAAILEMLKKKAAQNTQKNQQAKSKTSQNSQNSFNHLESHQGREDAEMLMLEKQI